MKRNKIMDEMERKVIEDLGDIYFLEYLSREENLYDEFRLQLANGIFYEDQKPGEIRFHPAEMCRVEYPDTVDILSIPVKFVDFAGNISTQMLIDIIP